MRTGFRWIATILFILLLPTWLLLLVPKLNGFGPEVIQREFSQNDVYPQLSQVLQQSNFDDTAEEDLSGDATNQALVLFRSALTPEYLENKTEKVLTQSSDWITGTSEEAPKVEFNDLRDQVVAAYPAAQLQIDELQRELTQARESIEGQDISTDGVPGLSGDGSASSEEIAEILSQTGSLDNFIAGDFTIDLENPAQPVKDAYWYYWVGMPLLGVILFLLLVAVFFLGRTWDSRARWAGWVLIAAGVVNGLLSIVFSVLVLKIGLDVVSSMIPGQAEVAGSIVQSLANAVFANYITLEAIMSGILVGFGVVMIIASMVIRRRTQKRIPQPAPLPDPEITPSPEPESPSPEASSK